jgi:peptidyl-prolyl cis-trans isomerase D
VAKGTSLDAAAKAKGLATSTLGPLTRSDLAGQASKAVADAAFSATRGSLSAPVRGALGWTIVRVDAVENRPARSLDQVRGEITAALTEQKRRTALADLSSRIEEEFDNGGNLAEAAKELAVEVKSTPAITADGRVYGTPGQQVAPELAKVVQAAFSMEREG